MPPPTRGQGGGPGQNLGAELGKLTIAITKLNRTQERVAQGKGRGRGGAGSPSPGGVSFGKLAAGIGILGGVLGAAGTAGRFLGAVPGPGFTETVARAASGTILDVGGGFTRRATAAQILRNEVNALAGPLARAGGDVPREFIEAFTQFRAPAARAQAQTQIDVDAAVRKVTDQAASVENNVLATVLTTAFKTAFSETFGKALLSRAVVNFWGGTPR